MPTSLNLFSRDKITGLSIILPLKDMTADGESLKALMISFASVIS
jgi:hypothetical protein